MERTAMQITLSDNSKITITPVQGKPFTYSATHSDTGEVYNIGQRLEAIANSRTSTSNLN